LLRWLIGLSVATAVAIAWIDQPLARWIATFVPPRIAGTAIQVLEYAAWIEPWKWAWHIALVGATLAALRFAPAHFRRVAYIALVALLSRNLMGWIKSATGRVRPLEWHGGPTFFEHGISFPSGHVVLFAGLAVPIALAYPRAWPVLIVVPIAMLARLAVDAHFLSDVLGGLALVVACCYALRNLLSSTGPAGVTSAAATSAIDA